MEINKDDMDDNTIEIEQLERQWEEEQNHLAACVTCDNPELEEKIRNHSFERIGGLDISYDDERAVGCLVVYNPQTRKVVYSDLQTFTISVPYIPGYLAYREMPIYRSLLTKLKQSHSELFPEVILVDGQGRLHPRHCGSACVVGLEFGCPTIGVGKNMFCGESFVLSGKKPVVLDAACDVCSDIHECKRVFSEALKQNKRTVNIHHYGEVIGLSYCPPSISKPIFISIGTHVSLNQALHIVSSLCNFRLPEPIRFADHLSRMELKEWLCLLKKVSKFKVVEILFSLFEFFT